MAKKTKAPSASKAIAGKMGGMAAAKKAGKSAKKSPPAGMGGIKPMKKGAC